MVRTHCNPTTDVSWLLYAHLRALLLCHVHMLLSLESHETSQACLQTYVLWYHTLRLQQHANKLHLLAPHSVACLFGFC